MTGDAHIIRELKASDIDAELDDLCQILMACVHDGAAISFMHSLTRDDAETFWMKDIRGALASGERRLFSAFLPDRLVGTVQLVVGMPPNQPHRAEISKMMVHPDGRRRGFGQALMTAALNEAKAAGKTLVTLDTRTGDASQAFYRTLGFEEAGVIPDFAYDPDGKARHATTYMYRYL